MPFTVCSISPFTMWRTFPNLKIRSLERCPRYNQVRQDLLETGETREKKSCKYSAKLRAILWSLLIRTRSFRCFLTIFCVGLDGDMVIRINYDRRIFINTHWHDTGHMLDQKMIYFVTDVMLWSTINTYLILSPVWQTHKRANS